MSGDKAEQARWAEYQLGSHTQKRRTLGYEQHVPPPTTAWDRDTDAPPPALVHRDDEDALNNASQAMGTPEQRASSGAYSAAPDKWASRFRDGPAPPPPPPPITDRDVVAVMVGIGIDPRDPRAQNQLDNAVERGVLGTDPKTRRPYDVYEYIRAQQRATQKRKQKRGQLDPRLASGAPNPPPTSQLTWKNEYPSPDQFYPYPPNPAILPRQGGPMQPPYDAQADYPVVGRPMRPETDSGYPSGQPMTSPGAPPPHDRPPTPSPAYATDEFRTAQDGPLTQSQKRRLRRKRQRQQHQDGSEPVVPNFFEQPVLPTANVPDPNGYAGMDPQFCGAEVYVQFAEDEGPTRMICPLTPFPHPNQPHLITVPPELTSGVEVFIGWFDPDPEAPA